MKTNWGNQETGLDNHSTKQEARLSNIHAEFVLKVVNSSYVYLTLTFDPKVKGFKHIEFRFICHIGKIKP